MLVVWTLSGQVDCNDTHLVLRVCLQVLDAHLARTPHKTPVLLLFSLLFLLKTTKYTFLSSCMYTLIRIVSAPTRDAIKILIWACNLALNVEIWRLTCSLKYKRTQNFQITFQGSIGYFNSNIPKLS